MNWRVLCRWQSLSLCLALTLLCVSCSQPRTDPPQAEAPAPNASKPDLVWLNELIQYYQQASTITADLIIRVKAPLSDALVFQVNLWCPADGRVRLKCTKFDVAFIDALVQANGDFVLELVQSKEVVRGNLRDVHVFDKNGAITGPPFLTYLSVLVQEAKVGPIPDGEVQSAKNGRIEATDHTTGLSVTLAVNPDDSVASKSYFDQPGKESVRLDYQRYQMFGLLRRPTRLQVSIPGDNSEYTVRLRTVDAVPAIAADSMRFSPSPGSTELGLEAFLKRIRD